MNLHEFIGLFLLVLTLVSELSIREKFHVRIVYR